MSISGPAEPGLEELQGEQGQLLDFKKCFSLAVQIGKNFEGKLCSLGVICTYGTDTCDVVTGQDFVIAVTETDDKVSIFISFAALRLTVAAVQLHLDLTLAVTLHG